MSEGGWAMSRTATAEETVEKVAQAAKGTAHRQRERIEMAAELPGKAPSPLYIGLTVGSIVASLVLFGRKQKDNALFVGLWAPTFLALGLFAKLVGMRKKD